MTEKECHHKEGELNPNFMTKTTHKRLKEELKGLELNLKKAGRSAGEAAGEGHDWHDNFSYEQATRDIGIYATQVGGLRKKLDSVEFIEPNTKTESVQLGNTVVIKIINENKTRRLTILGPEDTDFDKEWISYKAPFSQAIIGKKVGESVLFKSPKGKQEVEIISILPGEFE